jgi:hypothetical protein
MHSSALSPLLSLKPLKEDALVKNLNSSTMSGGNFQTGQQHFLDKNSKHFCQSSDYTTEADTTRDGDQ